MNVIQRVDDSISLDGHVAVGWL